MNRRLARALAWSVRSFAAVLGVLLVVRFGIGDRSALLFALNSLLLYAFLPVPLIVGLALFTRRSETIAVGAASAVIWAYLWGDLFVPRVSSAHASQAADRRFVVLSFNVMDVNRDPADSVRVIRDSGADLVAIQELNPRTAALVERELGQVYPHRWLEPHGGSNGRGILSKAALERKPALGTAPDWSDPHWLGPPMAAEVQVHGRPITVVNFHAASGPAHYQIRDRHAQALVQYARAHRGSLVLLGDLNATDQNTVHARLTKTLRDAWRDAGFGFGHTFPGIPTKKTGGARPTVLGIPVPMWLVRIDYVFHSPDLRALDAKLATYDGRSDHRGVIATLAVP